MKYLFLWISPVDDLTPSESEEEDDTVSPDWSKSYFGALDAICRDFTFDLAINVVNDPQHLRTCSHIPNNLVELTMRDPTKNDISWLVKYETKNGYGLILEDVDDIRDLSDLTRSRSVALQYMHTADLKDAADLALFNQIRRAHPNTGFKLGFKLEMLSQFLLDRPEDVNVYLTKKRVDITSFASGSGRVEGLRIVCDNS